MLKFLIILFLVTYVLIKVGGFFFRAGAASQQGRFQQQRRPVDGNVNVDSAPKKPKKTGNVKGGDYIDYEEVR